MIKTVLFTTIQFSMSTCQRVLLGLSIGSYQVPPLRASEDQEAMAMKGYSTFTKTPVLLKYQNEIV